MWRLQNAIKKQAKRVRRFCQPATRHAAKLGVWDAEAAPMLADVLRALHNAVEYYTEAGRLGMAAKQLRVRRKLQRVLHCVPVNAHADGLAAEVQEVAETMEKQGLKEEAIEFYTQVHKLGADPPSWFSPWVFTVRHLG